MIWHSRSVENLDYVANDALACMIRNVAMINDIPFVFLWKIFLNGFLSLLCKVGSIFYYIVITY